MDTSSDLSRVNAQQLMAYSIAKQVSDFSLTYNEADYILAEAKGILQREMSIQKPTVPETPIDRYGNQLEKPM